MMPASAAIGACFYLVLKSWIFISRHLPSRLEGVSNWLNELIACIVFGSVVIWASYRIAPESQRGTARFMFGLTVVYAIGTAYLQWHIAGEINIPAFLGMCLGARYGYLWVKTTNDIESGAVTISTPESAPNSKSPG